MRKAFIYLIIGHFTFIQFACQESLILLPPDGLVKEEFWTSKENVQATLIGAYQQYANMDERLFYYGELRGGMLREGTNLALSLRDIMISNIYPDNPLTNWKDFYTVINYCNIVLKYSGNVKQVDPTFTDYQYRAYNAEAVFLRSLAYFYLIRIFKDVPFILDPYDNDDQNFFYAKTDSDVILDSLSIQLNRILPVIPLSFETNDKTRGRATRGAVNALLADIALWRFDYQSCINYVENIENSDLYQLVPSGDWFSIFSNGNTLEGILEIQFDSKLNQNNQLYILTRAQNNRFLASAYSMEILAAGASKEPVRGRGTIREEDQLIWKYLGRSADGTSFRSGAEERSANWIVYRLADVLLMKAEALSQLNRFEEAYEVIRVIRERAFVTSVPISQSSRDFEDIIMEERAKELAYEGKRWFDLLRMGRRNNFERKDKLIEIVIENAPATQKRVLAAKLKDPNGWYLPINNKEIESNLNLIQNPYYQSYQ